MSSSIILKITLSVTCKSWAEFGFFWGGANSRPGGGGCKSKFASLQSDKVMFFPFVRNSRPGGGVLTESFEPFLRVLNYIFHDFMGVLTRDRGGITSANGHLAPQKFLGVLNVTFFRGLHHQNQYF